MNHNITFVTSIYTIDDEEWCIEHLKYLIDSNIQLYIFLEQDKLDSINHLFHKNIQYKIVDFREVKPCEIYNNIALQEEIKLPSFRNFKKDTTEYLLYTNSKAFFIKQAIEENYFNTTQFAWIDSNIFYILKQKECSQKYLQKISQKNFQTPMFVAPGCISKFNEKEYNDIVEHPFWRFCSGFFLADRLSMIEFCNIYYDYFSIFLTQYKRLIWDMNFMAWMEGTNKWSVHWYIANHNDSILYIPTEFYAKCLLLEGADKIEYSYPPLIDEDVDFYPSSASYLYFQGKHILNTRFVNYYFKKDGRYHIHDLNGTLYTKNIRCILDNETMIPIHYGKMLDQTIDLSSACRYSHGLEDLRLFEFMGKVWFVSSNMNYSPDGRIRIMIGEYDQEQLSFHNCKILQPPTDSMCEKNWIPIVHSENEDEMLFIYSWFPMQIGTIENDQLQIIKTIPILEPFFYKVRGSSIFIKHHENEKQLIGVVHYSEETFPRKYYHMLVTLDADTFKLISYSDPFYFQHVGVEFCIGFTIQNDQYVFWVSKNDNNAAMIRIDKSAISLFNIT